MIWLLPSEAFKRASMIRRQKLRGLPVSDPDRAVENLLQRDLLLTAEVWRQFRDLGLTGIEIDGSRDLLEVTASVEAHFRQQLLSG